MDLLPLRKVVCALAALLAVVLVEPRPASAQTVTGTIDGIVRDTADLPVPGVRVVVNSQALIRTDLGTVSDAQGYYRLPLLPPGEYELTFSLASFQTITRSALIVQVNRTTSIDVVLVPVQVAEAVTVVGQSPTLDQRGAMHAFNYGSQLAENIPTARTFEGLVTTIPGVESAGNYGVSSPGNMAVQNVLGSGARANSYSLDGFNTTDPAGQWNVASLFSFDIIEEVQVSKAAKPAEVGYQGGLFSVVTKSGGNQFSGQSAAYFQSDALQSQNAGSKLQGQGVQTTNALKKDYELTATMGGPLKTNRAWWFGSVRRQDGTSTLFGFPEDVSNTVNASFGKVTYQASPFHRFTSVASSWDQTVSHFFFGYAPAVAGDANASVYRPINGRTFGLKWDGILGDNLLAEAGWSTTQQGLDQSFQSGAGIAIIHLDRATQARFRNSGAGSRDHDFDNWSYRANLSWFVPNALGRHDVKVGGEVLPTRTSIVFDDIGDIRLRFRNDAPNSVQILSTPSHWIVNNNHMSFFAQDSWTIHDRLTLDYGVRFERSHASTPEQETGGGDFAGTALAVRFPELERRVLPPADLLKWNNLAPRLAAVYSLDSRGRTIVRASASRYHHFLEGFAFYVANPAFPHNFIVGWNDRNNDREFQVGEDGFLFARFGGQINTIAPDISRPYTNEFTFGVSHEPFEGAQVGATVYYRKSTNLTEIVDVGVGPENYTPTPVSDPGPDGAFGTADDATLTVFAQDAGTIRSSRPQLANPPGNDNTYKALEVTATKRMSDRWQAVASLIVSEMEVIKQTVVTEDLGPFRNPNSALNAKGKDPANQTVQFKLQGTYLAPYDIVVSGFYRFLTGLPYTRQLLIKNEPAGTFPQGDFTVFAEPRGSRTVDNASILDIQLEKRFQLGNGMQLGALLDVFNLTNASPTVQEVALTGDKFGDPLAIWNPRIARLGARLSW